MDIRLQRLSLKNFKGLASFDLVANGENVVIMGDNATGKTTLADSFRWLLFGKDSLDQAQFEIKPLVNGQSEHGVEVGVAAHLAVDKKRLQLRKVLSEKWTKKRGSATKEFTGNTTDFYIDGVPAKLKEYQQKIADLCDENLFKLLTNPRYFNEVLHWQKRREMLLEVCGDVTDADVIASDQTLAALPEILDGHSLEDYRKILAGRRKEINQELEKIPVRIDELMQSITDRNETIGSETVLKDYQKQLGEKQAELSRIQTGGEIAEKTKALREIEGQIADLQNKQKAEQREAIEGKQKELDALRKELREVEAGRDGAKFTIETNKNRISEYEQEIENLRGKFYDINNQTEPVGVCPACGQDLPEQQLQEVIGKFNLDKADKLEKINEKGKALKAKIEELQAKNTELQKRMDRATIKVTALTEQMSVIESEINAMQEAPTTTEKQVKELQNLLSGKELLESSIAELRIGSHDAEAEVQAEIESISGKIADLQAELAKVEASKKAKARIDELKAQERTLAGEFEKTEAEIALCEAFTRAKVGLLESRINDKFKLVKWKLFEDQINGGISETCIMTIDGVPYPSLNSAGRIQGGCDVIRTLQDHYNVYLPLFVDNKESVTELPEMKCQVISLVVSPGDETLRIETSDSIKKEAA